MPPVSLRLDAFLYVYLYSVTKSASDMVIRNYKSKQAMLGAPILVSIADINLKDPQGMVFPKKGKTIRLPVSQAIALHTTFKTASTDRSPAMPVLQLYGLLDKALTDYTKAYSFYQ